MPLIHGYGHATFVKNIRRMIKEKKPRDVAAAIAFRVARDAAKHAGVNPAWLRRRQRARRVKHRRPSR